MSEKKRTFGIKVVARRVLRRQNEERAAWWDKQLGITGHSSEEYPENLQKIRNARAQGLDPYDFDTWLKELGYVSNWTPKQPGSSLDGQFPYSQESKNVQKPKKTPRGSPRGTPRRNRK